MSLDKPAVAMDDSLRIVLRVVNASAQPVMVYPSSAYGPCMYSGFELFDREWRPAHEGYVCLGTTTFIVFMPEPVALNPGETMEITRWWRPEHTFVEGQPIEPGLYYIRGAAAAVDRTFQTPPREIFVGG